MIVIKFLACLFIIVFIETKTFAQLDTLKYHIGTLTGLSTQKFLPHWATANRFGVLKNQDDATGLIQTGFKPTYTLSKKWSLKFGLDAVIKVPFMQEQNSDLFLQQAYVKVKFDVFELSGGRIERTVGTHAEGISSGSLAWSGNTRPIPLVLLEVPVYSPVPFTKGFVEYKGTYAHGWLGEERFVKHAYLHEKSLYLKFGGKFRINFSAGLVHYALWGGEIPSTGKLPSDFLDYMRLVLGKSAEGVDLNDPVLIGEAANALGDHKGIYDFGIHGHFKNFDMLLYHQTPFEDWTGTRLFRNKDRLLGINFKNTGKKKWLESVVYEFLYTKYQSGPSRPGGAEDVPGAKDKYGYDFGGRDNYYNNYLYKTGWVYQDRIIGTPLFYTLSRMKLYEPEFVEPDRWKFNFNVVNNRIVTHHIGVEGELKNFNYKFLSTFTKNYGTYGGINGGITEWGSIEDPDLAYTFKPPKNQHYFLLEIESHPFSKSWSLLTAIAWDTGGLSRNFGALVGLKREGIIRIKTDK